MLLSVFLNQPDVHLQPNSMKLSSDSSMFQVRGQEAAVMAFVTQETRQDSVQHPHQPPQDAGEE